MCLTGAARVAGFPVKGSILPVVVATGLTSSLPMIPSLQLPIPLMRFGLPNVIPASEAPPVPGPNPGGWGERYITSVLLTNPETGHWMLPGPISSLTR